MQFDVPKTLSSALAALLTIPLVASCGSDDKNTGGNTDTTPVKKTITAKDGGSVASKDNKLTLAIPAGALAADTEISVAVVSKSGKPQEDKIAATIYELGPDGTMFTKPVTLEFAIDVSKAPEGSSARVAFLKDNAWVQLEDSAVANGKVTATTTHFTPFTVIWVGGVQVAGACDDYANWQPCGGDLRGTWDFTLGCVTYPMEPDTHCPERTMSVSVDLSGYVTLDGTTFNVQTTSDIEMTSTLPKSCLQGQPCSILQNEDAVVTDTGNACQMVMTQHDTDTDSGTYTTSGNTFTPSGDNGPEDPLEYCVTGNQLVVRGRPDGNTFMYVATRR